MFWHVSLFLTFKLINILKDIKIFMITDLRDCIIFFIYYQQT